MNLGLDAHHLQSYGQTARSGADRRHHQQRAEHRDRLARHPTAPNDVKLPTAPESVTAGKQAGTSVTGRLDTHWSRILHHDVFTTDTGSIRERSALMTGAILLGICVAMYFAVAGIMQILALPDAASAVTPNVPTAPASVGTASQLTVLPSKDAHAQIDCPRYSRSA